MDKRIAVCPGSFDPITVGHLDIIARASKLFDNVIVAVMSNDSKKCSFTTDERVKLIEETVKSAGLTNVSVESSDMLLADYTKEKNASIIVKGLRAVSDFEYEFQMALTNHELYGDVETLFIPTSKDWMFLSSSIVKEVAKYGGSLEGLIPECLISVINKRCNIC